MCSCLFQEWLSCAEDYARRPVDTNNDGISDPLYAWWISREDAEELRGACPDVRQWISRGQFLSHRDIDMLVEREHTGEKRIQQVTLCSIVRV